MPGALFWVIIPLHDAYMLDGCHPERIKSGDTQAMSLHAATQDHFPTYS